MSTATARAYRSNFTGRFMLSGSRKSPEIKPFHGVQSTSLAQAHCIKDRVLLDPCMGSGHILVYAFDVLMQIYRTAGYTDRDAAKSILENNLYGLDIDDRAYQLAYFAVMMKAREYNRRILNGGTICHIYSISESNTVNRQQLKYFGAELSDEEKRTAITQMIGLLDTFIDAREYGSILNVPSCDWELLKRFTGKTSEDAQSSVFTTGIEDTREQLIKLIEVGQTMEQKYEVVVTNPPYMGSSGMGANLSEYVKKNYPDSKSDLFSCFIDKGNRMVRRNAYNCMVTMQSWMFLSSFEKMRTTIEMTKNITNLMHMENMVMGIAFGTAVTVFQNCHINGYRGTYNQVKLADIVKERPKEFPIQGNRFAQVSTDNFSKIPGAPIAYWASEQMIVDFTKGKSLSEIAYPRQGMATTNNSMFLRLWFEVEKLKIGFELESENDTDGYEKWFPYNKGGDFRKWYGNNDYVVNYHNSGKEVCDYIDSHSAVDHKGRVINRDRYFKPCVTWSKISSGNIAFRYKQKGFIFDVAGTSIFGDISLLYKLIGFLNTTVTAAILKCLSPTLNFEVGHICEIPVIEDESINDHLLNTVKNCISDEKTDWDSFETSWDFKHHPLIHGTSVAEAYTAWEQECLERFNTLKADEEELNRIFIDIYGLQDELKPEEEDKDVTVRKADLGRDIRSLISYAVGCMFGRYSLDTDGLAFAGGDWDESKYKSFTPDADNVLPITDEAYLPDDIVDNFCEWLKVAYGADTLEENLDFIAKALGRDGSSSREVIRDYFINDFFADHCKTYSVTGSGKRPIYWLFDSGKENGFKALVYMHRWNKDTITRVRALYLHKIQEKYENEVHTIDIMVKSMTDSRMIAMQDKRRAKLQHQIAEVKVYDEKLDHLANDHIEIDLDDGVKVNYQKVQTDRNGKVYQILAPIK